MTRTRTTLTAQTVISGVVTDDPTPSTSGNGTPCATFSVTMAGGYRDEPTTVTVRAWAALAARVLDQLTVGTPVLVVGVLRPPGSVRAVEIGVRLGNETKRDENTRHETREG